MSRIQGNAQIPTFIESARAALADYGSRPPRPRWLLMTRAGAFCVRNPAVGAVSAIHEGSASLRRFSAQKIRGSAQRIGRQRRRTRSFLRALGEAVIASRNSQHLSFRYRIIQIAGTSARLLGAVAPALGIIRQAGRHWITARCASSSESQYG